MRNFDSNWSRDNVAKWLIDRALEGAHIAGDSRTPYYKKCMVHYEPDALSLILVRDLKRLNRTGPPTADFMRSFLLTTVSEHGLDLATVKTWADLVFSELEEAAWVEPRRGIREVLNIRVYCDSIWRPNILEEGAARQLLSKGFKPYNLFWEEKEHHENHTESESISGSTKDRLAVYQS